jgi:hypothetical protein
MIHEPRLNWLLSLSINKAVTIIVVPFIELKRAAQEVSPPSRESHNNSRAVY